MAQLLKVYSDNAPPPEIEPFIVEIDLSNTYVTRTVELIMRGFGVGALVSWGDGSPVQQVQTERTNYTYPEEVGDVHKISVWGSATSLSVNPSVTRCLQWGDDVKTGIHFQYNEYLLEVPEFLPHWLTSCSNMFAACVRFNQNLNMWDVSNVTDMRNMFAGSHVYTGLISQYNQPLDKWNVSNVTDMSNMFNLAIAFNQDLSPWDVGNVTNMSQMFAGMDPDPPHVRPHTIFNGNIDNWDVGKVTNFNRMFSRCIEFTRDIGRWDTSSATRMSGMFAYCSKFNRDIGDWNVSNVTDMSTMFRGCSAFEQDLSRWCVTKITSEPMNFSVGTTSWPAALKPQWGTCPSNP